MVSGCVALPDLALPLPCACPCPWVRAFDAALLLEDDAFPFAGAFLALVVTVDEDEDEDEDEDDDDEEDEAAPFGAVLERNVMTIRSLPLVRRAHLGPSLQYSDV